MSLGWLHTAALPVGGAAMKRTFVLALVMLGMALSSCATVIKGTTQSISITTTPVQGAKCTLASTAGTWYLTSPASVVVERSHNDLSVSCTREGFHDAHQTILAHFNGATTGNVIVGGLAGMTIDAASGADYTYPTRTEIRLTPSDQPDAGQPADRSPRVIAGQLAKYPMEAQRNGWEGTVVVQVYVNEDGKITKARMTHSSGFDVLDNAAVESVLGWHFEPAVEHGGTASGWATVQVVFKVPPPEGH
jgi:TonB family protein